MKLTEAAGALFVVMLAFTAGVAEQLGVPRQMKSVTRAERTRIQGVADAVIWTTSAGASLGSGAVVAAAGFSTLGFLGVAVVLAPVWLLLTRRSAIAAAVSA